MGGNMSFVIVLGLIALGVAAVLVAVARRGRSKRPSDPNSRIDLFGKDRD